MAFHWIEVVWSKANQHRGCRFDWAARKLHKRLIQLGASEVYPLGEADEQHPEGLVTSRSKMSVSRADEQLVWKDCSYRGPWVSANTCWIDTRFFLANIRYQMMSDFLQNGCWDFRKTIRPRNNRRPI